MSVVFLFWGDRRFFVELIVSFCGSGFAQDGLRYAFGMFKRRVTG